MQSEGQSTAEAQKVQKVSVSEKDEAEMSAKSTFSSTIGSNLESDVLPVSRLWLSLCRYKEVILTFASGFTAGTVSRTITAPLDRLKLLMQEGRILQHTMIHPTCHIFNKNIRDNAKYSYSLFQLVKIILKEGSCNGKPASNSQGEVSRNSTGGFARPKSLLRKVGSLSVFWRGNGINCIKAGPEFALVFGTRQLFQQFFVDSKGEKTAVRSSFTTQFTISAAAGATAQIIVYPLELIKTRMAVAGSAEFTSILDCIRQTYNKGVQTALSRDSTPHKVQSVRKSTKPGLQAGRGALYQTQGPNAWECLPWKQRSFARAIGVSEFYRGLGANLAGIVPNRGVEMGLFFWLQDFWRHYSLPSNATQESLNAPLPTKMSLIIGAASSTTAQIFTYPLNLIRLRMQVQGMSGRPILYKNMLDCFLTILRKEGSRGLYRGLLPNLLKGVPSSTTMYVVFMSTKNFLNQKFDKI